MIHQPMMKTNQRLLYKNKDVELIDSFVGFLEKHRNSLGISDSLNAMWMKLMDNYGCIAETLV